MTAKLFTDLNVWKEGHKLVLYIYKISNQFPKKEQFILTSQILRSSISITSNIAEGFARKSVKEKSHFYFISLGSISELQNQCIIAKDLGYINEDEFKDINNMTVIVQKMLNNLIKAIRNSNK